MWPGIKIMKDQQSVDGKRERERERERERGGEGGRGSFDSVLSKGAFYPCGRDRSLVE